MSCPFVQTLVRGVRAPRATFSRRAWRTRPSRADAGLPAARQQVAIWYHRDMTKTTIAVPLSAQLKERLEAVARRFQRSPEDISAELLEQYVAHEEQAVQTITARLEAAECGAPVVDHADVEKWVRSFGTDTEQPRPAPSTK